MFGFNISGGFLVFYTPFTWRVSHTLTNITPSNLGPIKIPRSSGHAGYLYHGTLPSIWTGSLTRDNQNLGLINGYSFNVSNASDVLNYLNRYNFESINDCVPSPYSKTNECYLNVINSDPYCCSQYWDENCQKKYNECAGGPLVGLGDQNKKITNISVKISNPIDTYKIQVSKTGDFSTQNIFSSPSNINNSNIAKFSIENLDPNTKYYARVVNSQNQPIDNYVGSFKTAQTGYHSFKFGFASCSWSDENSASNQEIYDIVANKAINNELDFFIHLGDIHYRDIIINDERLFNKAYDDVFNAPKQNNCWKNLPMYYMWDDHDYGANDTDKYSPSRMAAIQSFKKRIPYNNLLAKNNTFDSPYYSFVRGRARFIITDVRSEREPKNFFPSDDIRQQIFSNDQKNWLFSQMLLAKSLNQVIVWANTKPWISSIENGKDDWGGYHAARMEIVDFINNNNLNDRIVIIAGDMHALAYDNGSSINNFGNLKVCHAAPLDQEARGKGGPYTIGPITEDSGTGWLTQFGILEINDNGSNTIDCIFKGIVIDKNNYAETIAINVNFNLYAGTPIL